MIKWIAGLIGAFILCVALIFFRAEATRDEDHGIDVITVAKGLEHPWSLAFLPDGRMLVTERAGRMRLVSSTGVLSEPLAHVPAVFAEGQGGLLDVVLDPRHAKNHLIYFSYAELAEDGTAGTAVARARLNDQRLEDVTVIFRQQPKVKGDNHWGSRLVFGADGTLFVTLGERYAYREQAQDLSSDLGKIVRINPDGSIPKDNPFVHQANARPEIWSYGHRNVQGAALHPGSRTLWAHEHGARGGDEINVISPGKNYGWPVISYGRNYDLTKIGEGTAKEGIEQPIYYWDPSIAPSGMLFYSGEAFPQWKNHLFIGALKGTALVRLELDGTKVVHEERLLQSLDERIRDVRQGPDGMIYLLTDSEEGRILKIRPVDQ